MFLVSFMSSFITVHSGMFQQEPTGRGSVSRLRRMFYCGAAFHGCHYLPFDFAVEATLDNHHADIMQQPRAYVCIYIYMHINVYIYIQSKPLQLYVQGFWRSGASSCLYHMFLIPDEHVQPKITAMYSQPAFRLEGSCNTIKRESDNLQDAAFSGLILGTPWGLGPLNAAGLFESTWGEREMWPPRDSHQYM